LAKLTLQVMLQIVGLGRPLPQGDCTVCWQSTCSQSSFSLAVSWTNQFSEMFDGKFLVYNHLSVISGYCTLSAVFDRVQVRVRFSVQMFKKNLLLESW